MGNSGDITPVMLYRVTHGNLDFAKNHQPKVAVLLCGTNNFVVTQSDGGKVRWDLGANCPPEDVAEDVADEAVKYATKEELEAAVAEMKAMYEKIMEGMSSQEMEVEVPAEELSKDEAVELSAEEPAAEPLAHTPEVEESAKMSFFKQNKPRNTMSVVYEKMFNK